MKNMILIGYSGHAFVVADIILQQNCKLLGYMEKSVKAFNPLDLEYLGSEQDKAAANLIAENRFVISIGDNLTRHKVYNSLKEYSSNAFNAIHPGATISSLAKIGNCVTIMAGVHVNSLAVIGNGVILNTAAVIEHECNIGDFAHIGPSATLAGNVKIGTNTFIGANSTIKEGIMIGDNVVVGAGSVVVKHVADNSVVYGNPAILRN